MRTVGKEGQEAGLFWVGGWEGEGENESLRRLYRVNIFRHVT